MKKKGIFIGRQLLLCIIALQMLNLSVGSAFTWDNDYDYSYTYNKTYDPTETAVEWIVELNYGQQPSFSYDTHEDGGKCLMKTFHWKTDVYQSLSAPVFVTRLRRQLTDRSAQPLLSTDAEMISPPPETAAA